MINKGICMCEIRLKMIIWQHLLTILLQRVPSGPSSGSTQQGVFVEVPSIHKSQVWHTTSYWAYRRGHNLYLRQDSGSVFRDLQINQYCHTTLHPHASRLCLHYPVPVFPSILLRPLANLGSPGASATLSFPSSEWPVAPKPLSCRYRYRDLDRQCKNNLLIRTPTDARQWYWSVIKLLNCKRTDFTLTFADSSRADGRL